LGNLEKIIESKIVIMRSEAT